MVNAVYQPGLVRVEGLDDFGPDRAVDGVGERVSHPVLTFEAGVRAALKRIPAWLRAHKPERSNFKALMFNEPTPAAQAQLFQWNGFCIGTRFFGTVVSYGVVVQRKPQPSKLVLVK